VKMRHCRLLASKQVAEGAVRRGGPNRTAPGNGDAKSRTALQLVIMPPVLDHCVPMLRQQARLPVHRSVFPAGSLVMVVNEEYPHALIGFLWFSDLQAWAWTAFGPLRRAVLRSLP